MSFHYPFCFFFLILTGYYLCIWSYWFLWVSFISCCIIELFYHLSFIFKPLGFYRSNIISSANIGHFSSALPILMPQIASTCLIALADTSDNVLNSSRDSWHPCHIPYCSDNISSVFQLNKKLAFGLRYFLSFKEISIFLFYWILEWILNFIKSLVAYIATII